MVVIWQTSLLKNLKFSSASFCFELTVFELTVFELTVFELTVFESTGPDLFLPVEFNH